MSEPSRAAVKTKGGQMAKAPPATGKGSTEKIIKPGPVPKKSA